MLRKVMKRAWEIARAGYKRFGGKVREYFAISLKMAWDEIKNSVKLVKKLNTYARDIDRDTTRLVRSVTDDVKSKFFNVEWNDGCEINCTVQEVCCTVKNLTVSQQVKQFRITPVGGDCTIELSANAIADEFEYLTKKIKYYINKTGYNMNTVFHVFTEYTKGLYTTNPLLEATLLGEVTGLEKHTID